MGVGTVWVVASLKACKERSSCRSVPRPGLPAVWHDCACLCWCGAVLVLTDPLFNLSCRVKRSASAGGKQPLSRLGSTSQLSTASSTGSLSSLPSLTTPPSLKTWLAKPAPQAPAADVPAAGAALNSSGASQAADDGAASSASNSSSPRSTCGVLVSVMASAHTDAKPADAAPAAAAGTGLHAEAGGPAGGFLQAAGCAEPGAQAQAQEGPVGPELVGFVLLDPLWEGGQEVGYVTSMMRMKRSAHTGEAGGGLGQRARWGTQGEEEIARGALTPRCAQQTWEA